MSPAGRHTIKLHGIAVGYSELEEIAMTEAALTVLPEWYGVRSAASLRRRAALG